MIRSETHTCVSEPDADGLPILPDWRPLDQAARHMSHEQEQQREDVRCVFKQLAREWSSDGEEERYARRLP